MSAATTLKWIRRLGLKPLAMQLKKRLVRLQLWPRGGFGYAHRNHAYKVLSGRGLEVGALHCPASVPEHCTMEYCDALSKEQSAKLFPEIESALLVDVDYIVNLDAEVLTARVKPPYDFVIMNHVIEHVANPLSVLEQLLAVIPPDGCVLVSAPDKRFSFDKQRELTTFQHLFDEYQNAVELVDDEHYLDFIRHTAPELFSSSNAEMLAVALAAARERREHAHVWDSESFLKFLMEAIRVLHWNVTIEFISKAEENGFECFVVLKKVVVAN